MIQYYACSKRGYYHEKNNTVCQDAYYIKCRDDMTVAAVADGLGSELYSDVASKLASKTSVDYCLENIDVNSSDDEILNVITRAFYIAQSNIEKVAQSEKHDINQYDTTLSLVVIKSDYLYYGQAGDSGIIALSTDGLYKNVVNQQRDDYGCVLPLAFGENTWEIGKFENKVVSVFLATDGIYELLFPIYLSTEKEKMYIALARYLMDPKILDFKNLNRDGVQEKIDNFISDISEEQVNDDKTVVGIINTSLEFDEQDESYYREPDWPKLIKKYERKWKIEAYPELFKHKDKYLSLPLKKKVYKHLLSFKSIEE